MLDTLLILSLQAIAGLSNQCVFLQNKIELFGMLGSNLNSILIFLESEVVQTLIAKWRVSLTTRVVHFYREFNIWKKFTNITVRYNILEVEKMLNSAEENTANTCISH